MTQLKNSTKTKFKNRKTGEFVYLSEKSIEKISNDPNWHRVYEKVQEPKKPKEVEELEAKQADNKKTQEPKK